MSPEVLNLRILLITRKSSQKKSANSFPHMQIHILGMNPCLQPQSEVQQVMN